MFETLSGTLDPEFAAYLADLPEANWSEHPVYPSMVPTADRLIELLALPPAGRPTGELALIEPSKLNSAGRIDLLALLEQQKRWLDAVQQQVLAVIEAADTTALGLAAEAVSLVLRVPVRQAQNKLQTSRTLTRELTRTLALLRSGDISFRHAEVVTETAWTLDAAVAVELETQVLPQAPEQTVAQLRRAARRAASRLNPATTEERHQRALKDRKVGYQPADDGMVALPVLLGAAEGQLIFTRLTAAATLLPAQDPRTMDQKRADLLVNAVLSGLPHDALPELQGHRPSIQVVVSADTLLGLDHEPADLAGYGSITAQTARRLAADASATWRRLLTDPDTGHLLDIGKDSYRPPQRLRDFTIARDGVCSFPTCNQPGYRCEYEHIVEFGRGGETTRRGGALACRRHNLCKIGTGWKYRLGSDGSFTWTSDTGHRYRGHAPRRWSPPPATTDPITAPEPDSVSAIDAAGYEPQSKRSPAGRVHYEQAQQTAARVGVAASAPPVQPPF